MTTSSAARGGLGERQQRDRRVLACQSQNGGLPIASGSVRASVAAGSRVPTVTSWPSSASAAGDGPADHAGAEDCDLHEGS